MHYVKHTAFKYVDVKVTYLMIINSQEACSPLSKKCENSPLCFYFSVSFYMF